jgi:hypothetical protein
MSCTLNGKCIGIKLKLQLAYMQVISLPIRMACGNCGGEGHNRKTCGKSVTAQVGVPAKARKKKTTPKSKPRGRWVLMGPGAGECVCTVTAVVCGIME